MKQFMDDDFLLSCDSSRRLYHDYAEYMPIADYHCHIDPCEIYENKRFSDLSDAWLSGDHYKWRLMRLGGVEERFITGDADPWEKFRAFASILPRAIGNPVYHWTHLELRRYFDCDLPLNSDTAAEIWRHCNARMPSVREILEQSNVKLIITTDAPDSSLEWHAKLREDRTLRTLVLPGFRVDALPRLDAEPLIANFAEHGCKSADLGTDDPEVIASLAPKLKERGWVMQLHIGALRNVNSAAFRTLGANTGFDAMGSGTDIERLAQVLDALHSSGSLPRTIIFSLNPNDNAAINALAGCFPEVQQGAAWWFNDSLEGISAQISAFASIGMLGNMTGMLTDSRSFLSYTRHEYFRRLLCNTLGSMIDRGELPADFDGIGSVVQDISYNNTVKQFNVTELNND